MEPELDATKEHLLFDRNGAEIEPTLHMGACVLTLNVPDVARPSRIPWGGSRLLMITV